MNNKDIALVVDLMAPLEARLESLEHSMKLEARLEDGLLEMYKEFGGRTALDAGGVSWKIPGNIGYELALEFYDLYPHGTEEQRDAYLIKHTYKRD